MPDTEVKSLNDFPVFETKTAAKTTYKLEDPAERKRYFEEKAGPEIAFLRDYLATKTFVGFLLGPKNSGKGTYTKLLMEAVGAEHVAHLSVGDIVRSVHKDLETEEGKRELVAFLGKRYRGFMSIEQALDVILGRDTKSLLPTEVILALVEREISRIGKKAIFIDGFPRHFDQVPYALYFRELMDYRNDPDFFVFISVPEAVIDERMKYRVICPTCQTPRNIKLLRTKTVGYDADADTYYLICDNPDCPDPKRMVAKEGDELGIEVIRDRIEADKKIMEQLLGLRGVPKVYLRNAVPVAEADKIDEYELTPAYRFTREGAAVKVIEEPWTVTDEVGNESYSLLPAAVVTALIKQTAQILGFTGQ
ncbi:nucleoside monophosphate kinase [Candidatus Berkelbacteria bacterium]|nr:nucleoside monophosphate kinase [Candidatus Berkelbacteria bacterium]